MVGTDGEDRGGIGIGVVLGVVALLGVATIAGMAVTDVGAPSGAEILDDAEQRYESAETVVGAATVTATNETATRTYEVSFTVAEENRSRVSISSDNRTVVLGTNGSVGWIHDERTGVTRTVSNASMPADEAMQGSDAMHGTEYALNESQKQAWQDASERARTVMYDWTEENTTATRTGRETVDGTDAWVVEVTSENESRTGTVTNWIAVDSSKVLKQELSGEHGTVTITYSETRFDISVADSTFQPPSAELPAGAEIDTFDALQNATDVTVPEVTDSAYEFSEGAVLNYGGETAVARYVGPENVTVFASNTEALPYASGDATETEIGGVSANVTEMDGRVAVTWETDGGTVALVTDSDRETAIELAESLLAQATAS
jgi:outer membrane lipoprotein-sorting protein